MVSKLTLLKRQVTRLHNKTNGKNNIYGHVSMRDYTEEDRDIIVNYIMNNPLIFKEYIYWPLTERKDEILNDYGLTTYYYLTFTLYE